MVIHDTECPHRDHMSLNNTKPKPLSSESVTMEFDLKRPNISHSFSAYLNY